MRGGSEWAMRVRDGSLGGRNVGRPGDSPSGRRRPRPRRRRRGGFRWVWLLVALTVAGLWLGARCGVREPVSVLPDVVPRLGATALSGTTVVIDPGHGGSDPGAMHGGVAEAAVTARLAVVLREVLVSAGARVLTTVESEEWRKEWREGELEPPLRLPREAVFVWDGSQAEVGSRANSGLYRRSAVAGMAFRSRLPGERVVFVSLHCDAVPGTDVRGAAVCYDIRSRRPELVGRLVAWLGRAGFLQDRDSELARDLGVLNPERNPVPESVLVEFATLTSAEDRDLVLDPRWRWRAARVLAAALAPGVPVPSGR